MNSHTEPSGKAPIRIAIAGLGFGETVHIPAARFNKNIELIGLWHPKEEKLQSMCKKYDLIPYPKWEEGEWKALREWCVNFKRKVIICFI